MVAPGRNREAARETIALWHPGALAKVTQDVVVSPATVLPSLLTIRHVTYLVGVHELHLALIGGPLARWAWLLIPGQAHVEVILSHTKMPQRYGRCDADGVASFGSVPSGAARFSYQPPMGVGGEPEQEVQTEWILIR